MSSLPLPCLSLRMNPNQHMPNSILKWEVFYDSLWGKRSSEHVMGNMKKIGFLDEWKWTYGRMNKIKECEHNWWLQPVLTSQGWLQQQGDSELTMEHPEAAVKQIPFLHWGAWGKSVKPLDGSGRGCTGLRIPEAELTGCHLESGYSRSFQVIFGI